MPVNPDGRWESWETRAARLAPVVADEPEAEAEVEEAPAPKAKRPRRSRKAAKAAIINATGADVEVEKTPAEDTDLPELTFGDEEDNEPE